MIDLANESAGAIIGVLILSLLAVCVAWVAIVSAVNAVISAITEGRIEVTKANAEANRVGYSDGKE